MKPVPPGLRMIDIGTTALVFISNNSDRIIRIRSNCGFRIEDG